MKSLTLLSPLLALTAAAPPQPRQLASTCVLDPTFNQGLSTPNYYIANWASSGATDGQQCSNVDQYDARSIGWHSTFEWEGESKLIRGNPTAVWNHFEKEDIGRIEAIPVSWEWEYEGTDLEAAVVYNLIGSGQGCPSLSTWVISIWLATHGSLTPNDGEGNVGELVASAVIINSIPFDVYRARGQSRYTWIFQAKENLEKFEGDLAEFVRWPGQALGSTGGAQQVRCVWSVQGGTEVWGGVEAKFTARNYTVGQKLVKGPIPLS